MQRYFDPDITSFIATSPYLPLSRSGTALGFVRRQAEAGEECLLALHAYPFVHIEPLEFFYTCIRSLGALDQAFFEALCEQSWRGVVWGAWLAMLEPRAEFAPALCGAAQSYPAIEWLVDCALAVIEGRTPPREHEAFGSVAARCRRCLDQVTRPVVLLRLEPDRSEITLLARERDAIRSVYATAGLDAALRCIPGTLIGDYISDHARWLRGLRHDHARVSKSLSDDR